MARTNEPVFSRVTSPVLWIVTTGFIASSPCTCVIALPSTNSKPRLRRILLLIFVFIGCSFVSLFLFCLVFHRGTAGNPARYNVESFDFCPKPRFVRECPDLFTEGTAHYPPSRKSTACKLVECKNPQPFLCGI